MLEPFKLGLSFKEQFIDLTPVCEVLAGVEPVSQLESLNSPRLSINTP